MSRYSEEGKLNSFINVRTPLYSWFCSCGQCTKLAFISLSLTIFWERKTNLSLKQFLWQKVTLVAVFILLSAPGQALDWILSNYLLQKRRNPYLAAGWDFPDLNIWDLTDLGWNSVPQAAVPAVPGIKPHCWGSPETKPHCWASNLTAEPPWHQTPLLSLTAEPPLGSNLTAEPPLTTNPTAEAPPCLQNPRETLAPGCPSPNCPSAGIVRTLPSPNEAQVPGGSCSCTFGLSRWWELCWAQLHQGHGEGAAGGVPVLHHRPHCRAAPHLLPAHHIPHHLLLPQVETPREKTAESTRGVSERPRKEHLPKHTWPCFIKRGKPGSTMKYSWITWKWKSWKNCKFEISKQMHSCLISFLRGVSSLEISYSFIIHIYLYI